MFTFKVDSDLLLFRRAFSGQFLPKACVQGYYVLRVCWIARTNLFDLVGDSASIGDSRSAQTRSNQGVLTNSENSSSNQELEAKSRVASVTEAGV